VNDESKVSIPAAIVKAMLSTPITLPGKVVDQDGQPVPHARVGYTLLDRFNASGSDGYVVADGLGNFEIKNVAGAAIGVNASKDGYYQIYKASNQRYAYGFAPDSTTRRPPTRNALAVLVLQKKGKPAALSRLSSRQFHLPRRTNADSIDLATGRRGQGALQISSKLGDISQLQFPWQYELAIPGGGLRERKGQFDFLAPSDGYSSSITVGMQADSESWSSSLSKEYFATLPGGNFARFSITFYPGHRNFVVIEAYVNPESGNRNLEFDPALEVKPY